MTDTALATTTAPNPPIVVLRQRLEARRGELKAALTDIPVDQFIRAVMTSVSINPDILACSFASLWLSCMKACRDGLLPDGIEGAIVPYKGTANWIPMYQGLLRRFRRSGSFKWITANVVREGEEFSHYIDENGEHLRHVPGDRFDAPIQKIYAIATTKDGGIFATAMTMAEANKIKAMSKATRDDAPWRMWPEEMLKKTALRRLSKLLPSARDLMTSDDEQVGHVTDAINLIDQPAADTQRQTTPAPESEAADKPASAGPALDAFAGKSPTEAAHHAGVEARAAGVQRRAMPGELREPARTAEADAWLAGWDAGSDPKQAKG